MGFEGANVIFDTWVHPLMMGLEEHLIHMFRDDFEFNDKAAPSHLGMAPPSRRQSLPRSNLRRSRQSSFPAGRRMPRKKLQKVPFFVRGKARRNTERYATERGLHIITVETLYDAKSPLQPLRRASTPSS